MCYKSVAGGTCDDGCWNRRRQPVAGKKRPFALQELQTRNMGEALFFGGGMARGAHQLHDLGQAALDRAWLKLFAGFSFVCAFCFL